MSIQSEKSWTVFVARLAGWLVFLGMLAGALPSAGQGWEPTPQQSLDAVKWIAEAQADDPDADINGDGRVTLADFNALVASWTDEPVDGPTDEPTDDTNGDGGNDPPQTETGWTDLTPPSDAVVLYVATNGTNSNDGLSEETPILTLAEGLRRLRDGYPDHLLLRRGDTFNDSLGSWSKSGRSKTEKMVVGAYGDLSKPRPVINTGTSRPLSMIKNDRRAHLAFVSLEFVPGTPYRHGGISLTAGGVEDILFEDVKIAWYVNGISMNGTLKDIVIRRCVLADNAGVFRSNAIYAEGVDGLLIEENIVDRNGWREDLGRDVSANAQNHNIYIQRGVTGVEVRNNIIARASSHALQIRSGGDVHGNLFLNNPISLLYGNEGNKPNEIAVFGEISDNVVLGSNDLSSSERRRWGVQVMNSGDVKMLRNVIAAPSEYTGSRAVLLSHSSDNADNDNLVIEGNAISGFETPLLIGADDVKSIVVEGNQFAGGGELPRVDGVQYRGNTSLPGALGPGLIDFVDDELSISVEAYFDRLRDQRRGNWDPELHAAAAAAWFQGVYGVGG
ncbi:MAG: right-handed parallel beta-helix repeat-containing protein [Planctomycetota bacterium]